MSQEIHVGPMNVAGPFHTGKALEIVVSDITTRLLLPQIKTLSYVRNSWNIFTNEQIAIDKTDAISQLTNRADRLSPLPSAKLTYKKSRIFVGSPVEFRDDNEEFMALVFDALYQLKEKNLVIPGYVQGMAGLFLDIDAVCGKNVHEFSSGASMYPSNLINLLGSALNPANKSAYMGKIPITKIRKTGIKVPQGLLESDSYYSDSRFSPQPKEKKEGTMCVSPLTALALVPYTRYEKEQNSVAMLTVAKASAVRYVLISLLLSTALEVPQIERIHCFGKIRDIAIDDPNIVQDPEWGTKVRFVLLDHLSDQDRVIPNGYFQQNKGELYIPSYGNFRNRLAYIVSTLKSTDLSYEGLLTQQDWDNLTEYRMDKSLIQMDYGAAFQQMKALIYRRSKEISQGTSPLDPTLVKLVQIFFPDILMFLN